MAQFLVISSSVRNINLFHFSYEHSRLIKHLSCSHLTLCFIFPLANNSYLGFNFLQLFKFMLTHFYSFNFLPILSLLTAISHQSISFSLLYSVRYNLNNRQLFYLTLLIRSASYLYFSESKFPFTHMLLPHLQSLLPLNAASTPSTIPTFTLLSQIRQ